MHLFTGVSMKGFVGEVNLDKHHWYMNSVHVGVCCTLGYIHKVVSRVKGMAMLCVLTMLLIFTSKVVSSYKVTLY